MVAVLEVPSWIALAMTLGLVPFDAAGGELLGDDGERVEHPTAALTTGPVRPALGATSAEAERVRDVAARSREEHELDQQAENNRTVPELEQLHVRLQVRLDPAHLRRQARVEARNFGAHLGNLR